MIKTSKQLKDLIRNLSKENSSDAQILIRNYMMERFLERMSISEYRDKFIIKGGILVAAMVGYSARSTMDLDATMKDVKISIEDIECVINKIISISMDDGITFCITKIQEIMDDAEYPGIRVSMQTQFDGVSTPLKIDISTGDIITPHAIRYEFGLMLESRSIEVWAYNLETVLAEKMETIISRDITNTRMRDFYDIHVLLKLYGNILDWDILKDALSATSKKRASLQKIQNANAVFGDIKTSSVMQRLWKSYQKKYIYANDIEWEMIMKSVEEIYDRLVL